MRANYLGALAACLLVLCAVWAATAQSGSKIAACPGYYVIDSRGSGEAQSLSPAGALFAQALKNRVGAAAVKVAINPYAAVGILPTLKSVEISLSTSPLSLLAKIKAIQEALNGVGALARIKRIGAYHASVVDGESKLGTLINQTIAACPKAKLLLVGYSQGAQVTGDVYQTLNERRRQHIAGVVLFGDPRYDHLSFASVYQRDNNGILPVRREFPASTTAKVLSYCHARDGVCQGLGQLLLHGSGTHKNYDQLGEPKNAVTRLLAAKRPGEVANIQHQLGSPTGSKALKVNVGNGYFFKFDLNVYKLHHGNDLPALPYSGRSQLTSCQAGPLDAVLPVAFRLTNATLSGYSLPPIQVHMDLATKLGNNLALWGETAQSDTTECDSRDNQSIWLFSAGVGPLGPSQSTVYSFFVVLPGYYSAHEPLSAYKLGVSFSANNQIITDYYFLGLR